MGFSDPTSGVHAKTRSRFIISIPNALSLHAHLNFTSTSFHTPFSLHSHSILTPFSLHSLSTIVTPFSIHSQPILTPCSLHSHSIIALFSLHSNSILTLFSVHSYLAETQFPNVSNPSLLHSGTINSRCIAPQQSLLSFHFVTTPGLQSKELIEPRSAMMSGGLTEQGIFNVSQSSL